MLTDRFLHLMADYTVSPSLANSFWLEIFAKYSEHGRHYHTTEHLEQLLAELDEIRHQIIDWDTVLFALFYHDIVHSAIGSTNEAESARIAKQRLEEIGYPEEKIAKCESMIMATKLHKPSEDPDTNFFIDADLAVLGQPAADYQQYVEQIRKEYAVFPDLLYDYGRKKMLQHYLKMDCIYKTDFFFNKYESQARKNLENEWAIYKS
jgi:predicted metal-dependent HD superfamily phosphohydrolase